MVKLQLSDYKLAQCFQLDDSYSLRTMNYIIYSSNISNEPTYVKKVGWGRKCAAFGLILCVKRLNERSDQLTVVSVISDSKS